jgi:hypothetical protein
LFPVNLREREREGGRERERERERESRCFLLVSEFFVAVALGFRE